MTTTSADPHEACQGFLAAEFAKASRKVTGGVLIEAAVTDAEPLAPWMTPYTCPHGTRFWIEPTARQHELWDTGRSGVPVPVLLDLLAQGHGIGPRGRV